MRSGAGDGAIAEAARGEATEVLANTGLLLTGPMSDAIPATIAMTNSSSGAAGGMPFSWILIASPCIGRGWFEADYRARLAGNVAGAPETIEATGPDQEVNATLPGKRGQDTIAEVGKTDVGKLRS